MGYRHRRYKNWRSRTEKPTLYKKLLNLFGNAIWDIQKYFVSLEDDTLNELLIDYGSLYGKSAEKYARKTFPNWKSGLVKFSGQTMERLVTLVPPYLSPEQRFELLKSVIKHNDPAKPSRVIRINIDSPNQGLLEVESALSSMRQNNSLAHIPEKVLSAATWLYDDDITAARAMIAEIKNRENQLIIASATREIELLRKTILSGQLKTASYKVNLPSGTLSIVAYEPSKCFVVTVCFGENSNEVSILRNWRDRFLLEYEIGRRFTVWYYCNGEVLSKIIGKSIWLKIVAKIALKSLTAFIKLQEGRISHEQQPK